MHYFQLSESQLRQYIDAEAMFSEWRRAMAAAKTVRGSMFWRNLRGKATLIRVSTTGAQTVIGKGSPENKEIHDRFMQRKAQTTERVRSLRSELDEQTRLNRALRVGRTPDVIVKILNAIDHYGFAEHLTTIGTNALFAYESAAGIRIQPKAMATRDVDLFFDVRKKLSFFEKIEKLDGSLIQVLQKADPTFMVIPDQRQTAINKKGFEVDIVRRQTQEGDLHPLRMSKAEDDFFAVQIPDAQLIDSAVHFSQMVVSTTGQMALMNTIDPVSFVRLKRIISKSPGRDALKRPKDARQAEIVELMIAEHLLQK